MATSYEEQVIKWAAKKYKIPQNQIGRAELSMEKYYGGYCETCQYSDVRLEIEIYSKKNKLIKSVHEDKYDFSKVLAEIIEA